MIWDCKIGLEHKAMISQKTKPAANETTKAVVRVPFLREFF